MADDRLTEVLRLVEQAVAREGDARAAYLDAACGGDAVLRREVEALLAEPATGAGVLDTPPWVPDRPPLAPGTRLGPYEIGTPLGSGGMGEVYKARDTRLDRPVAIKVLPSAFAADPERRVRFEREAKTIAGLNHPNICTLHDIGQAVLPSPESPGLRPVEGRAPRPVPVDYLVLELLEGATLSARLEQGPLPLDQALKVGTEIAEALAAAHRQGIVHRDLKPANVMLTKSGAKVLDFGLAKLRGHGEQPVACSLGRAESPPMSLTAAGTIVGTLPYMAPEQLEGKPADERTDIWALGAILCEMVTGTRAFAGNSQAALITAIMSAEPPTLATLKPSTPASLDHVVSTCLAKDPEARWQAASDVARELRWIADESHPRSTSAQTQTATAARRRRRRFGAAVAAAAFITALAAAAWLWRSAANPLRLAPRANLAAAMFTSYAGIETQPSFSPDGNKVAFTWDGDKGDNQDIYVKQIGSAGTPMRITSSAAAEASPAWSPDDRWIAFTREQPDQGNFAVVLIPPLGGPERKLTEATGVGSRSAPGPAGLCWTPDGKWLVFSERYTQDLMSVSAISVETGARRRLTAYATTKRLPEGLAMGDTYPSISPDGRALAFARGGGYVQDIHAMPLTDDLRPAGEPVRITDRHYPWLTGVQWSADGREIMYAAGSVYMQSLWRVSASGKEPPERLPFATPDAFFPAIAPRTSRLAYAWRLQNVNLWRLDLRTGQRRMLIGSTYDSRIPHYSPDGRKIAFQSNRSGDIEVWTCDADGSNCLQLTAFGGAQCGTPRWSPDSRWIALDAAVEGEAGVYVIPADGGTPRQLGSGTGGVPSWSADGRWVYFSSDRSGRIEIWKMPAAGGQTEQVTHAGGFASSNSPDGRYIYYIKQPGPPGLFRMPATGGEEEMVVPSAMVNWASVGVSAKGVYFVADRSLQFFDAATGKISTLAAVPVTWGLTVSPDDRYVVWAQIDRNTTDLMLVDGFR
jgi:serine/threonine protein kinase/Tol biopolymer transport system component